MKAKRHGKSLVWRKNCICMRSEQQCFLSDNNFAGVATQSINHLFLLTADLRHSRLET